MREAESVLKDKHKRGGAHLANMSVILFSLVLLWRKTWDSDRAVPSYTVRPTSLKDKIGFTSANYSMRYLEVVLHRAESRFVCLHEWWLQRSTNWTANGKEFVHTSTLVDHFNEFNLFMVVQFQHHASKALHMWRWMVSIEPHVSLLTCRQSRNELINRSN